MGRSELVLWQNCGKTGRKRLCVGTLAFAYVRKNAYLCTAMYLHPSYRRGKQGVRYAYWRLCDSYRDYAGVICRRDLINVGRLDDFSQEDINAVAKIVTEKAKGAPDSIFAKELYAEKILTLASELYSQLIAKRLIDLPGNAARSEDTIENLRQQHERRLIARLSTLRHTDVREIGAEHLCHETIKKLRIHEALLAQGFSDEEASLAVTQIAIRATHPASELATASWIRNNSDICRLTGYNIDKVTKDKLYKSAIRLYDVRKELMSHLSSWTKELFDYDDNLILYDLTNTYAEGCYDNSKVWDYGRSKEKRHDCKLIVLALVVNSHGFPKHYQLFDGRMTDADSLQKIMDSLDEQMKVLGVSPIVVMDAGISTEDNLAMLKKKGYKYLCVSRSSSKIYDTIEGERKQQLKDNRGQSLEIQRVKVSHKPDKDGNLPASATDNFYWVRSEAKAAKENGMYDQFTKRFLAEIEKIKASLSKKHGTKKTDKVMERLGRAKQKYPSVSSHYDYSYTEENGMVTSLECSLKEGYDFNEKAGVYFLQTNLDESGSKDGITIWKIYNILKEVESSFRCMKTDLDLRPVYHKSDVASLAHLHLGILAYWVVTSIRYQLRQKGITKTWSQILEIMLTQKSVTSEARNLQDESIRIEQCSDAMPEVSQICEKTGISTIPYKAIKSVWAQIQSRKNEPPNDDEVT